VPQPAPCPPPLSGHGYLCCSRPSRQEKLPVQTQICPSPPEPQNTRKHPKKTRERQVCRLVLGKPGKEGANTAACRLSQAGFVLPERSGAVGGFVSEVLIYSHTHEKKKPLQPFWEAGGRPGARRARMLWCYLRSLVLLVFPGTTLRHGQERREGE